MPETEIQTNGQRDSKILFFALIISFFFISMFLYIELLEIKDGMLLQNRWALKNFDTLKMNIDQNRQKMNMQVIALWSFGLEKNITDLITTEIRGNNLTCIDMFDFEDITLSPWGETTSTRLFLRNWQNNKSYSIDIRPNLLPRDILICGLLNESRGFYSVIPCNNLCAGLSYLNNTM